MLLALALLPSGELAAAEREAPVPKPRINRNPAYRQSLPPAAPLPPDPRDVEQPADDTDSRATVIGPPPTPDPRATTVPEPSSRPGASSPRTPPSPR